MKRRKDAEESHAINKQMDDLHEVEVRIGSGKNDGEDQNDLNSRCQLPINAGWKRTITRDKQNHHGHHEDQYIAAKNNDREPPSDLFLKGQNNKRRRKQQFIGDRIEICAQGRALVEAAREQAIDPVRKASNNKHQQRPSISLIGNKNEKEGKKSQAEKSDLIRNRPDAAFHCNSE